MEQLVQQIREAVASQGPQWLMKIAEEFGTAAAAVPEVRAEEEPPAESSGAEPRGRPQRRRQPPTRLSPSPAAKKGGRSSPRAAGACGSGAARSQRPADAARRGDRRSGVAMGPEAGGTLTRSGGAVQRSDNRYAARNIRHNLASSAGRASSAQSQRSRGVTHELGSERHAGQRRDRTSTPPGPSFLMAGPGRNKADVEIQGASPDGGRRGGMLPCFLMANNRKELLNLVRKSVTEATWRRYNAIWKQWFEVAGEVFPNSEQARAVTLDILANLRGLGASADAAKKHVSAIAFLLRLHGSRDVTKDFVFTQILKGWRKEKFSRDGRRPITFELLCVMMKTMGSVCVNVEEATLFRAAFSLVFFAALRLGELVSASRNKPGGLQFSDVLVGSDDVKIRIRKSKTDVYGAGEWLRIGALGTEWCPVRLVRDFMVHHSGDGPLLVHAAGAPLTRYQFTAVMRSCLKSLGFAPNDFGSHSFRIGAATSAFVCGLRSEEVKRVGRWKSEAYRSYVRPDLRVL
ncbi:uncharacterized protein [Eleutherodactylus coqui]|uniref:uncharacterized protein isoform X1 n=1 Tax=Eleutherodactylus coqui TaxID=57060 RepID=UPI003461EFEA